MECHTSIEASQLALFDNEILSRDTVFTRIISKMSSNLCVTVVSAEYPMNILSQRVRPIFIYIKMYLGHWGHGLSLPRDAGGRGSNSKLTTDLAPCRIDVPIQSFPVSPPPITMTSFPLAFK